MVFIVPYQSHNILHNSKLETALGTTLMKSRVDNNLKKKEKSYVIARQAKLPLYVNTRTAEKKATAEKTSERHLR